MSKPLDEMTKEEVADLAAAIFNFQLMGAGVIVKMVEEHPWLLDRAPCRWETEAIIDLARRGKTIVEADDAYYQLCRELRHRYSFDHQLDLWEGGEPCFPLLVSAAMTELHDYAGTKAKLASAFGTSPATVRRWELGLSKPHPDLQRQVVDALRQAVLDQREQTALE